MNRGGKFLVTVASIAAAAVFLVPVANASTTDGTIDPASKYAWGSKTGWINFGNTNGNVHVTDAALTGYAWNDLYGWINLSPSRSGVKNNAEGVLSGSAWSETLGWVDFSGVTINNSGLFLGQATGENTGVINFSCTNCSVKTDWRPLSSRSSGEEPPPTGGGGGGGPIPTTPPAQPYSIEVNNGAGFTTSTAVSLKLEAGQDANYAWVSEDPNFLYNTVQIFLSRTSTVTSAPIALSDSTGNKTVYAKFCTQWGYCGNTVSDTVIYNPNIPIIPPGQEPDHPSTTTPHTPGQTGITPKIPEKQDLLAKIEELVGSIISDIITPKIPAFSVPKVPIAKLYNNLKLWVPYLFKDQTPKPKIPIERFVAKVTPKSMRGRWEYLDPRPTVRFVFAPLPKEFLALEKKFPAVKNTFRQVGINRFTDVAKMNSVQMHLPGLTQSVTPALEKLSVATPETGSTSTKQIPVGVPLAGLFSVPRGIPESELPAFLKNEIPSDIVFARAAGQLVDFKIALSLTSKGQPEQKINTISGKPLHLTIRPDKPVKRVRGFVIFRSKTPQARAEIGLKDLIASAIFAEPVFAYDQKQPVPMEEKLVLQEFEYTDPDGDGLYTADVHSPIPAGEYEIITVMDYEDPSLGSKQVRLITVVDPEGYIFEKIADKELRIPGAIATLYYFNPDTKRYEEWPAKDFQQDNPQITDVRGTYSFLVPGGMYYLKVSAPGYIPYEGKPFPVEEGSGVHTNIELKAEYWWLKVIDWKTALLVGVALLLAYNFYKDRRRTKS